MRRNPELKSNISGNEDRKIIGKIFETVKVYRKSKFWHKMRSTGRILKKFGAINTGEEAQVN